MELFFINHIMKRLLLILTGLAVLASCCKKAETFSVIPQPNDVTFLKGSVCVKGAAVEIDPSIDKASREAIGRFVKALETATGVKCKADGDGFDFKYNPNLGPEQYYIEIEDDDVEVEASALNGFIYACETIKQMLPAAIYGGKKAKASWVLPCVKIFDEPRFGYRGMHLDCSRHFWTIEETKRYIDVMVAYKLNRLHWHLTDDQGWRIEIKSYPRLTEVGAWRDGTCIGKDFDSNDGIRYGGFYTQEQLREIVDYAAARGIEVIPEVDLPGHMVAALAAYPELGCTGGPYKVWPRWGIAPDILCAGNDKVFDFLESVLSEVIDIFPSEYIHIGGDECFDPYAKNTVYPWDVCPKCAARMRKLGIKKGPEAKHLLQSYVTARVQQFVNSKGRRIIGWDEILEGELAEGATVMSWRGVDGGIKAASLGFDAIMTPHTYAYFDYYQSKERDKEPLCIGGYLPLENVYAYEPFDGLAPGAEDHILGVQANLWTEYITTPEHLEYMLLPRMCALSEIQWCDADKKDYARFCTSLDHTFEILDAMGVNYCLDYKGQIGFDRQPARDSVALAEYLEAAKSTWGW